MAHPVFEKLKASTVLPSPVGVALEISRLADAEDTTIPQMAALVERDSAIASRLLKLVNSPAMGVSRRVASVSAAVSLIGLRTVKMTALGFSLLSNNRTGRCEAFDYDGYWSQCLGRAVAARYLASSLRVFAPDEVFTCGLLSKVGQLALAAAFPKEYSTLLQANSKSDTDALLRAEERQLGIDHNVLSAEMMGDWRLPRVFQDAARGQDAPASLVDPAMNAEQLAQVLHAAGVASSALLGADAEAPASDVMAPLVTPLGLDESSLDAALEHISQQWSELGVSLGVPTPKRSQAAVRA